MAISEVPELDEWLLIIYTEAAEHDACQSDNKQEVFLTLPEVGLEFSHHTACS